MKNTTIRLNGIWQVDYISDTPYTKAEEPSFGSYFAGPIAQDSITSIPVPGYWEDMADIFRSTPLYSKLSWNPRYTLQRYPQTGYVPDMALPNPYGTFAYQRSFMVSDVDLKAECELYVGGVQNALSAWINGVYIGRHEGYSAGFSLKIPPNVIREGENAITLAVSNIRLTGYKGRPISGLSSRAANECTGGIWGDIEVRFYPDGIRDVWVATIEDCGAFVIKCVGGNSVLKKVGIYDEAKLLSSFEIPRGESEITVSSSGYILWTPDTPKLYTAVVETAGQRISRRFGIRRLTAKGTRLYLNGLPYFFRGTCEHLYQPFTVHPTRDKNYYRQVIRMLKSLGFNSIRFHTWIPMPEYMEAADELGMVLEVETPNNTTYAEWQDIVNSCRRFTSVCAYSSGNEMIIDEEYIEHIRDCSNYVHSETDSLFSPMSAMPGIEYREWGEDIEEEPIRHNPKRLASVSKFCDLYNSYSLDLTSYESGKGDYRVLDAHNAIYKKPILSHEICIFGTYCDLSLEERYRGTRIGDTEFLSSVRRHLEDKKLLDRANLYYRNSSMWQADLRKHCFETVRRSESFAGYDFLGDIDTHWHTFGYCVGMMNEFYELKPGETKENVLRYNGATVLLCDLPKNRNFWTGEKLSLPILVSNYGALIENAILLLRISAGGKTLLSREIRLSNLPTGEITPLYMAELILPSFENPKTLEISARLFGADVDIDNRWQIYVFPKVGCLSECDLRNAGVSVVNDIDENTFLAKLKEGERIVLFGTGPFPSVKTAFQISIAGRTTGHLATVVSDHPVLREFPHEGYCSWQFAEMMNEGKAIILNYKNVPHNPVIDIATTYKNVRREALMFECRVGKGRLFVSSLGLLDSDPASTWLKVKILTYAMSEDFSSSLTLSETEFLILFAHPDVVEEANTNVAMNQNDITM